MKKIVKIYQDAFRKSGPKSPASVLWPKGRQDERFRALTRGMSSADFSVLDYGCGLGALYGFLKKKYRKFRYTGVDIVPEFISENKKRHKETVFKKIKSYRDVRKKYDYILASGTFNLLYSPSAKRHKAMVYKILGHLFSKAGKFLAVNFMTDKVDFKQPGAYHQNIPDLYEFITRRLSRRVLFDASYLPYEFTVIVYKDRNIDRRGSSYKRRLSV